MTTNFGSVTYGYACSRCGTWVPTGTLHTCANTSPLPPRPTTPGPGPTGWICPVCKKGNAPWAATCGHCVVHSSLWGTAPLKTPDA